MLGQTEAYCSTVVNQLLDDKIEYVYSDWRIEETWIATMSKDKIEYGTLKFTNDTSDLWEQLEYLTYDQWFEADNFERAYIILTDRALQALSEEFSPEYKNAFMSNLELVHTFSGNGQTLYFYRGSEKMYHDMIE